MQVETLSIRLSKLERSALRAAAKRGKISQGQLVRRALHAYGVVAEKKPAASAYDLVKDLIGRQSGAPADLSTNPKYLDGFGQ